MQGELRGPAARGSTCSQQGESAHGRGPGRGPGRGRGAERNAAGPLGLGSEGLAGRVPGHGRQVSCSAPGPAASGFHPRQLVSALL